MTCKVVSLGSAPPRTRAAPFIVILLGCLVLTRKRNSKRSVWRVELVFVTALVSVILTELSAAETQPHGPYTFRNARLELFQTGIGSTGLRYCCRKFCKNDEDKIMTKTSSTLHTTGTRNTRSRARTPNRGSMSTRAAATIHEGVKELPCSVFLRWFVSDMALTFLT